MLWNLRDNMCRISDTWLNPTHMYLCANIVLWHGALCCRLFDASSETANDVTAAAKLAVQTLYEIQVRTFHATYTAIIQLHVTHTCNWRFFSGCESSMLCSELVKCWYVQWHRESYFFDSLETIMHLYFRTDRVVSTGALCCYEDQNIVECSIKQQLRHGRGSKSVDLCPCNLTQKYVRRLWTYSTFSNSAWRQVAHNVRAGWSR